MVTLINKITPNHYVIKLLRTMLAVGAGGMRMGNVQVTLTYPEGVLGLYTLTLSHCNANMGLMFNILHNAQTTTFITSVINSNGGAYYQQHTTLTNKAIKWGADLQAQCNSIFKL